MQGRDTLLGGDLTLEIAMQETCHSEYLALAHEQMVGLDKIPVTFLHRGRIMETIIDMPDTRRSFLAE
jgi:hypothetical protein